MVTLEQETATQEIFISKNIALLEIQANQNDPVIFQTFFCATCQKFLPANGLFPGPEKHTQGHHLAWVPSVDEPAPGRPAKPITSWLSSRDLGLERHNLLVESSNTSTSLYWGFFLESDECSDWIDYLWNYLDDLAECWLNALNGLDTAYFKASEIWVGASPQSTFFWKPEEATDLPVS